MESKGGRAGWESIGGRAGEGEHWKEVELRSKRGRGRAGDRGRVGERGRESRESLATRLARLVSVI